MAKDYIWYDGRGDVLRGGGGFVLTSCQVGAEFNVFDRNVYKGFNKYREVFIRRYGLIDHKRYTFIYDSYAKLTGKDILQ